jgi:hypothetical protein
VAMGRSTILEKKRERGREREAHLVGGVGEVDQLGLPLDELLLGAAQAGGQGGTY